MFFDWESRQQSSIKFDDLATPEDTETEILKVCNSGNTKDSNNERKTISIKISTLNGSKGNALVRLILHGGMLLILFKILKSTGIL